MMTRKSSQEDLMIRYLLGSASEEEQARLEAQFFTDDEQYQQLQAVEDELRYEYAQGGLSPGERKSFESRFLNSAEDRQKVELAKAVLDRVFEAHGAASALAPKESTSWRQSFSKLFAPQRLSYTFGALAVVAMSVGSWLMVQTIQLRDQVDQLQAQRKQIEQDAQQRIETARQQQDQLSLELEKQRARGGQSSEKSSLGLLSFVLIPGLVRDADGPKRLIIPPGSSDVQLQLDAKTKNIYRSYRAELQDLDGAVLWSRNVPQLFVTIPARLLARGDYVIALKGINAAGTAEDAGEFYFQVVVTGKPAIAR